MNRCVDACGKRAATPEALRNRLSEQTSGRRRRDAEAGKIAGRRIVFLPPTTCEARTARSVVPPSGELVAPCRTPKTRACLARDAASRQSDDRRSRLRPSWSRDDALTLPAKAAKSCRYSLRKDVSALSLDLEILSAFQTVHVPVLGDVMLDRYVFGDVQRVSREAPIPILRIPACGLHAGRCGKCCAQHRAHGGAIHPHRRRRGRCDGKDAGRDGGARARPDGIHCQRCEPENHAEDPFRRTRPAAPARRRGGRSTPSIRSCRGI